MSKKVLIVQGGWDGHEPKQVSARFKDMMEAEGFEATVYDDLDCLKDESVLKELNLIIPIWTMGKIEKEQLEPVLAAVASGVGLAGCHGGMCDAFRESVQWQFMTGGNWVSHPGGDGTPHRINIKNSSSSLVEGIKDFDISSEQYYLHVDPAVEVLATCRFPVAHWFHSSNKEVDMPVVWTKRWGYGRVYYNSLGHHNDIFDIPEAKELMRRGLLWASEGKDIAVANKLDSADFESKEKMF
jgi:type 1 glutamine amidotransferase